MEVVLEDEKVTAARARLEAAKRRAAEQALKATSSSCQAAVAAPPAQPRRAWALSREELQDVWDHWSDGEADSEVQVASCKLLSRGGGSEASETTVRKDPAWRTRARSTGRSMKAATTGPSQHRLDADEAEADAHAVRESSLARNFCSLGAVFHSLSDGEENEDMAPAHRSSSSKPPSPTKEAPASALDLDLGVSPSLRSRITSQKPLPNRTTSSTGTVKVSKGLRGSKSEAALHAGSRGGALSSSAVVQYSAKSSAGPAGQSRLRGGSLVSHQPRRRSADAWQY